MICMLLRQYISATQNRIPTLCLFHFFFKFFIPFPLHFRRNWGRPFRSAVLIDNRRSPPRHVLDSAFEHLNMNARLYCSRWGKKWLNHVRTSRTSKLTSSCTDSSGLVEQLPHWMTVRFPTLKIAGITSEAG